MNNICYSIDEEFMRSYTSQYLDDLNCDQIKALYEYIQSDHVVINSGRQTGKSRTLKVVLQFWLEYQMKDKDRCIVIGRSYRANKEFIDDLCSQLYEVDVERMSSVVYKLHYNDKVCYIELYTSLRNYRLICDAGLITPSLIVGDERYIPDDMCSRTACAFTQYRKFIHLPPLMNKARLRDIKDGIGNKSFDIQIGQYLPDGWLDKQD